MWTFWPAGRHQDAHDVQLLLQRLRTATSLHDKREAVAQLCTKEARVIGAEGMVYLIELLRTDAGDLELLCGVMDLLSKLTADADCGPFLNVFIQSPTDGDDVAHPVRLVLDVLRNDDFMVRYSAVQLLTRLLQHNSKAVTEQILRAPNSVASLVDILEDSRESVRNEGLLLLKALVANDPELQAAVAFSNGFELLFNIIKEESKVGSTTVIIDDALQVINALLRNPVTQRSFREMGFFAQLNELLLFDGQEVGLDTNGVIQTVIDIVHMVVSASVPVAERQKTKHVLCATSIVANLVNLLVSPYCSTATTLRALLTLRVLAEGDTEVHRIVLGPVWEINGGPAPTGLVVLLQIVMNDTDDQRQKLALEVVKHILVDPQGQVFVAASVKPLAPGPLTPGQVLASALFSSATTGIVPMYYAAHLLQFAVHGNPEAKLQLLHALWDTGSFFRTLVRQITDSIRGRNHVATVLCMRVLLALVDESPTSAAALLEDATRLAFFVQTTISDDEDLHTQGLCALLVGLLCLYYPEEPSGELTRKQVYDNLVRRIGFDCFSERWTRLRSDPQFQNAGRIPHAVLYDEFYAAFLINIYERVATYVKQQVTSIDSVFEMARNREQVNMNDEQLQQAFQSAQQCILLQEQELTTLREELRSTKESARMSQSYQAEVARLERDYAAAVTKHNADLAHVSDIIAKNEEVIASQAKQIAEAKTETDRLREQLRGETSKLQIQKSMSEENINALNQHVLRLENDIRALVQTKEAMEDLILQKDGEIERLTYAVQGGAVAYDPTTYGYARQQSDHLEHSALRTPGSATASPALAPAPAPPAPPVKPLAPATTHEPFPQNIPHPHRQSQSSAPVAQATPAVKLPDSNGDVHASTELREQVQALLEEQEDLLALIGLLDERTQTMQETLTRHGLPAQFEVW